MYTFTVMSTLGYGAIIPVKRLSQGMTMIFAATTIPLYLIMIMVYAKNILQLLDVLVIKTTSDVFKQSQVCILLTKTTAAQNEVALSYHKVHGLYFLAVVFVTTDEYRCIICCTKKRMHF